MLKLTKFLSMLIVLLLFLDKMNSFKRIQTNIVSNSYRINKRNSNLNTFPNSDSYSRNSYIYNSIKLFGTKAETVSTDSIPKFSFGVIADIQYADIDDAMNFQKTKVRRYRNSLKIFKDAAHYWKSIPQLSFNIILGDIIDGKANEMNIQHNCYAHFKEICEINSNIPHHLCYGNHCHYCFDRSELFQFLPINKQLDHTNEKFIIGGSCNPAKLYYDWSPFPGWRFIVLDSYDVSLIGASSAENKKYAEELLYINNPNDLTMSGTWFNNLSKDKYRWVPYNGGIGKNQLKWLQNVLKESKRHEEKVIIFSHQPIFAETKSQSLIWNSEEVLDILWESNNVHMWMAGHDHDGQYSIDGNGIHHIVPPAPIERGIDDSSYGHISVHENELLLHWNGYTPQNVVKAWPKRIPFLK